MNTSRFFSGAAFAAAATLVSSVAGAQGVDEFGAFGGMENTEFESPQNAAFEVRFGPYTPNVDDEFGGGATPYEDTFGDDTRWMIGLEVDWQAIRIDHFGSFGPGVGWGYTTASADAPLSSSGDRSEQETSLSIMPMYAVGVLRVDVLTHDLHIPLVPYAKAGLGFAMWWSGDADESGRDDQGTIGRGLSYGFQWALGIMLHLDPLDRGSARTMDLETGVNNSYLFIEWYNSMLDGFGGDVLQVGTSTWIAGLALEI